MLKKELYIIGILFICSFIVRFIYLEQVEYSPLFQNPVMDEKYHLELVEKINHQNEDKEPFFRAPLYPYFLASLSKLTNGSLFRIRLIQIILGSMLSVLIYLFGSKFLEPKYALIAGIVAIFYPTFIYYDSTLLITFLITLMSILLLFSIYRYKPKSFLSPLSVGIILGIAGLARPNVLLFGPFLLIWVLIILKNQIGTKQALFQYLVIGLAAFIVIIPTALRNYKVSGDPVFIAWQGGMNFYIGNNQQSNGWSATLPGIDKSWEGGYTESIAQAEKAEGRALKRSEVSNYWYGQAIDEIIKNPGHFVSLLIQKIRLLINGYEIPNNQNIYLNKTYSSLFRMLISDKYFYFPFGLLIPLALIGIYLSISEWKKFLPIYLFVGAYSLSLILFFVCARFRQPMIPFFIIFSLYAISKSIVLFQKKQFKKLSILSVCFLLLFIESNHDLLKLDSKRVQAEDYHLIGNAYLEQNNLLLAENEFIKSVKVDPTFARGYNNIGMIQGQRGNHKQAQINFKKAMELNPDIVETYVNYATTEIVQGNYQQAIQILDTAKQKFPLDDFVYLKLGLTYYQAGDKELAIASVKQAIDLNPMNNQAKSALHHLMNSNP